MAEDIIFGEMQKVRTPIRRHLVYSRNISLKSLISFNLDCNKSSIMILDFSFTSGSSEGSDEPVHLHSLATLSIHCSYAQNIIADSDETLANTTNIMKIVDEPLRYSKTAIIGL